MTSNELRAHLSNALKGIQDGSMKIEKAKAIGDIAQVAINLAKVEVDFAKAKNGKYKSNFFNESQEVTEIGFNNSDVDHEYYSESNVKILPTGTKTVEGNITTHKMRI